MGTWQVLHGCGLLCLMWMCFVFAEDLPTWMVLQYEGLDELFLQSRKSVALELKFNLVQNVCTGVMRTNFLTSLKDDFRSNVRGHIADLAEAGQIDENGYRRYFINDFEIYLYACTRSDESKEYFLSHAYEYDNLFFLFAYDHNTKEMELKAIVEEDADTFRDDPKEDVGDIELSYIQRRYTYYSYFHNKYPETQNQDEPMGDPVCSLSVGQKIRLCGLIMNTPYYSSKYTFTPRVESVDKACIEARLYLMGIDDGSTECMYRCYVSDVHDSERQKAIYISRAYLDYEVFVFELTQHEGHYLVVLDNNVGNLAFVEEVGYVNEVNPKMERTSTGTMINNALSAFHPEIGDSSPMVINEPLAIN